jgi:hypothetical protein
VLLLDKRENCRRHGRKFAAFLLRMRRVHLNNDVREAYVPRQKSSLIQMDLKGSLSPRRQNEIAPIKTIGLEKARTRYFYDSLHRQLRCDIYLRADITAHIFVQHLLAQTLGGS